MTKDLYPFILPLVSAMLAGGFIGLEREWRGRAAGFRTHILVCLASALLMQASVNQGDWVMRLLPDTNLVTDPTRMAHGILTGIGFLCAGVIFRTGFSIHGLTTAASLWITSALGVLFGAGLFTLGLIGAVATAVILVGLRLVSLHVPARQVVDAEVSWDRAGDSPAGDVVAAFEAMKAKARHTRFGLSEDGSRVEQSWKLMLRGEPDLQTLSDRLCALPGVTSFSLAPRDD